MQTKKDKKPQLMSLKPLKEHTHTHTQLFNLKNVQTFPKQNCGAAANAIITLTPVLIREDSRQLPKTSMIQFLSN